MREKKMAVVFFTPGGRKLAEKLDGLLKEQIENGRQGEECWQAELYEKPSPLSEWCRTQFQEKDALVFIGAMGIAVRAIAPCLDHKTTDPAVVVADERGQHVISVLSGHLGGGNELTRQLAELLGADPVITTASDVNEKIAIDVFAKQNQLHITSMKKAKEAAAAVVAGESVALVGAGSRTHIPPELGADPECASFQVCITPYQEEEQERKLILIPKVFVLGIGCRKGTGAEQIEAFVEKTLQDHRIAPESIAAVASIDLKQEEAGLLEFCKKHQIPMAFYSAEQLRQVPGTYHASGFVERITGVDNVCERAAMRYVWEENPNRRQEDSVVIEKKKGDGVTLALYQRDWRISFE